MPIDLTALEQFLRTTFVLGVFAVGGTVFLYICLWAFYKLAQHGVGALGALREWIPKWFASQVEVNQAVKASVESHTEVIKDLRETCAETNFGVARILAIVEKEQ